MSNRRGKDDATVGGAPITRRSALVRAGAFAGSLTALPGLLAACGDSDSTGASSGGATKAGRAALEKNETTRASSQPYDAGVAAGEATGLPKKVSTNFPAGSA